MEHAPLSEYQDALRDLLLSIMHQPGPHQARQHGVGCRILWALPRLVETLAKEPGEPPADEHEVIRAQTCSRCEYQDAKGYCPLRMTGECCLSREEGRVIAVIRRISQHRHVALDAAASGHSGDQSP